MYLYSLFFGALLLISNFDGSDHKMILSAAKSRISR